MILSKNREHGEYEIIKQPAHIERVWAAIEGNLPKYWNSFIEREVASRPATKLATHFGTSAPAAPQGEDALVASFAVAIQDYEKAAARYRDFFDPDAMEEFADDPNAFKQHLAKEVPVISGTLAQRRPELQQWQRDFRVSKGRDLLAVFCNVLDFREDWIARHSEPVYSAHNDPAAFELDPLDSDETMTLIGVIGMGIKSVVLYQLDPSRMPQRLRSDLYALYFLSGMDDFALPSRSSEFLMINDREPASNGSLIMEHNFWYPYGLFSLYALRIFKWISERMKLAGATLDPHYRYVYVAHFFNEICSEHVEHMKTMRAHDRFEVPT